MSTENLTQTRSTSLIRLDYIGIVLAVITGLTHLFVGVKEWGEDPLAVWFILAGIGFFGAVVLLWYGINHTALYAVGVLYTGFQFVAYFALHWPKIWHPIGIFDKLVQLALLVVLVGLYQRKS